jgi:hypothetical protein
MEKRKVAIGFLLVVTLFVLFYLVDVSTRSPAKIRGPGGFAEPQASKSGFLVTNLRIYPTEVQPNETVSIRVTVTNTHNTWGIYSLVLYINGTKEAEKQAELSAHGSQDVRFSVTRDKAGTYTAFINGLSGSFSVRGRASTEEPSR